MKYQCKRISVSKLPISRDGIVEPLCDSCKSLDCENPIQFINVSIMGINQRKRVYNDGNDPKYVISCEGYTNRTYIRTKFKDKDPNLLKDDSEINNEEEPEPGEE